MTHTAADWLGKLRDLGITQPVRIMNVCGGHERSISVAGLRTAIPENIELVPGPGCPVCICPEEDVFEAIQLALNEDIILVAFGDMLRVPVNVPKRGHSICGRPHGSYLEGIRTKSEPAFPSSPRSSWNGRYPMAPFDSAARAAKELSIAGFPLATSASCAPCFRTNLVAIAHTSSGPFCG